MQNFDVVIVGAGIAGLTAAIHLQNDGLSVKVIDSKNHVGGSLQTEKFNGFLLDNYFQALLTSFPEVSKMLNFEDLNLKPFVSGTMVYYNHSFYTLVDPIKNPFEAFNLFNVPFITWADKVKIAALQNRLKRLSTEKIFAGNETSTLQYLNEWSFSSKFIDAFFKPFLNAVFLKHSLQTSSRMFEFIFKMFAEGTMVLPKNGMGDIALQLANKVSNTNILLNTTVKAIENNSVVLDNNQKINARAILLATPANTVQELTGINQNVSYNSVRCLYFAVDKPPIRRPTTILNGNPDYGWINHLSVLTVINPKYAPVGRHLVSVTVIKDCNLTDKELSIEVTQELCKWFNTQYLYWDFLKAYNITNAVPVKSNIQITDKKNISPLIPNVYVCNDYLTYPSMQGCMELAKNTANTISWDLALKNEK